MLENVSESKFISEIVNRLRYSELSIFLGAGVSQDANLPSWKNLFKDIANEIGIDIEKTTDYYQVAQYCSNQLGDAVLRNRVSHALKQTNYKSEGIDNILKLPINSFWTTNFDCVLEENLKAKYGLQPDIIYRDSDLTKTQMNTSQTIFKIFKMNGHIDDPNSWVLTKCDLENYNNEHKAMLTFFKRELVPNTFLFLGYSFTDSLVLSALREIKNCLGNSTFFHYTILKKDTKRHDFEHFIRDLECSYGIKTLVVNEYHEINEIINTISDHLQKKQIYISGSFREINDNEIQFAAQLTENITKEILRSNYKICSGIGRRLGDFVTGSACRWLVENNRIVSKNLIMRPHPFDRHKNGPNDETKQYREYIMHDSGVAIFMFGQDSRNPTGSDGVRQEFNIAKAKEMKIIPLGVTGYEAKKIWDDVKENITEYGYLEKYIDKLNEEQNPEKLANVVLSIINELQ